MKALLVLLLILWFSGSIYLNNKYEHSVLIPVKLIWGLDAMCKPSELLFIAYANQKTSVK